MRLSVWQKVGWGIADMGVVVFIVVKQLLILNYLTSFLGVPVDIAGMVTTGVLVFDIITDPLIGALSDKTNSRFGRRAPWMFVGAVVMAGGIVGLFAVPGGLEMAGKLTWVIAFFALATIGFTMVAIPYGAQSGEMTTDPLERSTMTGWRMVFASIGILIGGALLPGLAASMGYAKAALAVAPIVIGAVWMSLWATRHAPRVADPAPMNLSVMVRLVFSNRPFVMKAALYGVMTLAVAIFSAGLPFVATYLVLDVGNNNALSEAAQSITVLPLLFLASVFGAILSQGFWVFMSRRIGKLNALVAGLALYIVALLLLAANLPSVNVTAIMGLFFLQGIANGAWMQIPWALYPDLMDLTRVKSGATIEGAFGALWIFGQKIANAVAPGLLGLILARQGWKEATGEIVLQPDAALIALTWSVTYLPALILLASIFGLLFIFRPALQRE
jgi:GPH family glycoside/pentoside/hexuronide:cation symporter